MVNLKTNTGVETQKYKNMQICSVILKTVKLVVVFICASFTYTEQGFWEMVVS